MSNESLETQTIPPINYTILLSMVAQLLSQNPALAENVDYNVSKNGSTFTINSHKGTIDPTGTAKLTEESNRIASQQSIHVAGDCESTCAAGIIEALRRGKSVTLGPDAQVKLHCAYRVNTGECIPNSMSSIFGIKGDSLAERAGKSREFTTVTHEELKRRGAKIQSGSTGTSTGSEGSGWKSDAFSSR